MEVVRADRQLMGQRLEGDGRVLLKQAAGSGNFLGLLPLRVAFVRLTALAGAKSVGDGGRHIRVKTDVFRSARRERQEGRQQTPVVSTANTN